MGLDVKVYNNVEITQEGDDFDFIAYVIDVNWLHKIKNLQNEANYKGDLIFRGISYPYSSHNRFREELIKLIDRTDLLNSDGKIKWDKLPSDIPFNAFIDFADNEGCLDWEVSETIYLDFEKYNEKAKAELDDSNYSRYKIWMTTFEESKNNKGVVVFS